MAFQALRKMKGCAILKHNISAKHVFTVFKTKTSQRVRKDLDFSDILPVLYRTVRIRLNSTMAVEDVFDYEAACRHLTNLHVTCKEKEDGHQEDDGKWEEALIDLSKFVRIYPAMWRQAHKTGLLDKTQPPFKRFLDLPDSPPKAKRLKRQGKCVHFCSTTYIFFLHTYCLH